MQQLNSEQILQENIQVQTNQNIYKTISIDKLSTVAVSEDGQLFAYVNISDQVIINVTSSENTSFKEIYLSGFDSQVFALSFSKDLKFIVCATKTIIYIFNIITQENIFKIRLQDIDQEYTKDYYINKIQYINNEQILIGTTNGYIIQLTIQQLRLDDTNIEEDNMSQQKQYQAANGDMKVKLVDFVQITKSMITSFLSYDNFNKLIVGDEDGQITVINSQNLKQNTKGITKICQLQISRGAIISQYLIEHNNIAIFGSIDNKVIIIDLQKIQILDSFTACKGDVLDIQAIENNKSLLVLSSTGELNVFDLNIQHQQVEQEAQQTSNSQQDTQYLRLLQLPDINALVQTQQSNTQQRQPKISCILSKQTLTIGIFNQTQQFLLCKTTSIITILQIQNVKSPQVQKQIISHSDTISDLQQFNDNKEILISSGKDGKIFLTNINTSKPLRVHTLQNEIISTCQYAQTLIVATRSEIKQFQFIENKYEACAEYSCQNKQIIKCIVVEKRLYVSTLQGDIIVYNVKTSPYQINEIVQPTQVYHAHSGSIIDICNHKNKIITVGVDLSILISKIDKSGLSQSRRISQYGNNVASCIYTTSQEEIIVCCNDGFIKTFSIEKLKMNKYQSFQSELIEKAYKQTDCQCIHMTQINSSLGLPNAITSSKLNIFVGTTNGQILVFNNQLHIEKIIDQEGKFISDSICKLIVFNDKYIISGLQNGSIEIWEINNTSKHSTIVKRFPYL